MATGFFTDERCFWHGGGNYAGNMPVGGLVQPGGGLPESPESKRRLKNLLEVTGLLSELTVASAPPASRTELARVHDGAYLDRFAALSASGGGEIGLRAPFGPGGYEIAALSAGLARQAMVEVMEGRLANAYALSRPPGHHALPDFPNGFCLINNIAVGLEEIRARGLARRAVVLDWDVHHGNGTEAIYAEDAEVLTISIHQERNYPLDTGGFETSATANLNIPLPPGAGHVAYLAAMERLVLPAIRAHAPDLIVVACGFDAGANDPLGRMLCTAETFREMTRQVMAAADALCGGRLVLVHEGGYSETYVPFCGHAVIETLAGSALTSPDPLGPAFAARQPSPAMDAVFLALIEEMAAAL